MNEADAERILESLVVPALVEDDERKGLPSASAWHRYELCAGSYQLERKARELGQEAHTGSAAAQRGERIHAWLAGDTNIELSESERQTAEFLLERATGERRRIFGEVPVGILREKRLWLSSELSGRFDLVYYTDSLALVIDYKGGFSEPDPAETNSQLKVLAVLVALHLPTIKEVVVQIISGPYGVTEARYDLAGLKRAYEEIRSTLKAINDPYAPLSPSIEACRYCPAINICQAVKNKIMPVAAMVSPLPEGERAAKLLDEVALLQNHLDSIRQYYTQCLASDPAYQIPGYALVPGSPRRAVKDWPAAIARLAEFIDQKEIDAVAQYSVPTLEGLLGKSIGVKGDKLKEQFALVLGDLLEAKYPAPTLKRVRGEPKMKTLTHEHEPDPTLRVTAT